MAKRKRNRRDPSSDSSVATKKEKLTQDRRGRKKLEKNITPYTHLITFAPKEEMKA